MGEVAREPGHALFAEAVTVLRACLLKLAVVKEAGARRDDDVLSDATVRWMLMRSCFATSMMFRIISLAVGSSHSCWSSPDTSFSVSFW